MREYLRQIVEQSDTKAGKRFDLLIQLLVVISITTFSIETLPNLSVYQMQLLRWLEIGLVSVFTAEYLLRLIVSQSASRFAFSFYGIVDLFSIVPFYLALGIDLRALRAIRLLRLFRILKLVRYSRALNRFHIALRLAKEELILFLSIALVLIYFAAVGIYYFEYNAQPEVFSSVLHSMWWAAVTLTTVGYGDLYPITVGGKFFTFIMLFIGLSLVAMPAGIIASALSKAREIEQQDWINGL